MDSLRLFIAIELDDALHSQLKQIQRQLQDGQIARNVRWVAPQNIHLTLKFLGNVNHTRVPALSDVLVRAARNIPPLKLEAGGLGCFPNVRRPTTIWVGLQGDIQTTALLVRQIEDECETAGLARDERGFTPHLTLGRVRREASASERAAIGEAIQNAPAASFGTIRADAVSLIASDLRPNGPIYTTVARVALKELQK